MSDPAQEPDIEDVLASVRRLVKAERQGRPGSHSALVLTPSQRVERPSVARDDATPAGDGSRPEPLAGMRIADADWEDDEPQDAFAAWSREERGRELDPAGVPTIGALAADADEPEGPDDASAETPFDAPDAYAEDDSAEAGAAEDAWSVEEDPSVADHAGTEDIPAGADAGWSEEPPIDEEATVPAEASEPSIEEVLDAVTLDDVSDAEPSRDPEPVDGAGDDEPRVAFRHDPEPDLPPSAGGAARPLFEPSEIARDAAQAEPMGAAHEAEIHVPGPHSTEADAEAEALRDEGYVDFDEVDLGGTTDIDPDTVEDAEIVGEEGPETDVLDEAALREMVADIVREELRGRLGERITSNVRKLVRREIHRILASRDFE